ncbi:MAG: hypothetical protein RBT69_12435 [Spirochaetia bacterium]|jgi:phosphoribosylaminoimidazolecarboxamide formyltransferase/IMP cyclohydrolase|nr:hypothetical protein [Spirochaetia bacterium]
MALNIVNEIDNLVAVRNILVSVSDKTGLDLFIEKLIFINPSIIFYSTGGTFNFISEIDGIIKGKNLVQISDYTKQPEMQGGLVKTLDFRIYTGILSEKYNNEHKKDLQRTDSIEFDMVVVNLYPFSSTIGSKTTTFEQARTNIDIGGPCMLRASAKNFHRVASVCDPSLYSMICDEMEKHKGKTSLKTRFTLARKTFKHTAYYDKTISEYISTLDISDVEKCYEIH